MIILTDITMERAENNSYDQFGILFKRSKFIKASNSNSYIWCIYFIMCIGNFWNFVNFGHRYTSFRGHGA